MPHRVTVATRRGGPIVEGVDVLRNPGAVAGACHYEVRITKPSITQSAVPADGARLAAN